MISGQHRSNSGMMMRASARFWSHSRELLLEPWDGVATFVHGLCPLKLKILAHFVHTDVALHVTRRGPLQSTRDHVLVLDMG